MKDIGLKPNNLIQNNFFSCSYLIKEKMEMYGAKLDTLEGKVAALEGSKIVVDI